LSALGILLKLRERYERVRSPVPLTLLFRWGPRASVRLWLAELENAGLVELTTSDGGVRELAELGARGFLTSITPRPWAPTVPEQIARMREGWRRRKRRERENVTPTVTPPPTPPLYSERGGSDGQGRRAREISKSAEVENFQIIRHSEGARLLALRCQRETTRKVGGRVDVDGSSVLRWASGRVRPSKHAAEAMEKALAIPRECWGIVGKSSP
jgi:hypothetical protein